MKTSNWTLNLTDQGGGSPRRNRVGYQANLEDGRVAILRKLRRGWRLSIGRQIVGYCQRLSADNAKAWAHEALFAEMEAQTGERKHENE